MPGTIIARLLYMGALKKEQRDITITDKDPSANYDALTNRELQHLLHDRLPGMGFMSVTDGNRETVIAMLKITEKKR